jgi:two-component system cell cycle sensor histidine kinase/response regulator CckA
VKWETQLEKGLLNIKGSPVHIGKAIMNLVSNAAEAISGEGTVVITTAIRNIDKPMRAYDDVTAGDFVVLSIIDNGTGISQEDIKHIFEPFYSKKVMGRSGTGLGMSVVWATMKDHKGYIDAISAEGKGTRFDLYFPVTLDEILEKEPDLPLEALRGGEKILVVDDMKEQREIASAILKKLGYGVETVSSGEEAVEYVKNNQVDLIILDMVMEPGIDGLETFKRIKAVRPGQKAIIASGFSESNRVKEAQSLGAGAYIKKPYSMEKLATAIRKQMA